MTDDRLRLVVDMQNKASAELRKLKGDMAGVKLSPGMTSAKTWFTELSSVSAATNRALNPVIGGLNTIGVGGLAAGLSIAGLVQQFRDLGKSLPALQELSRQTGMSRTEIERLKQTASNLNVDPSKMTAGLQAFSREMVGFHNRSSELYHKMVNEGAGGLAEKIRQEDPSAAFRDMLRYMDAIPASAQRAGRSAADAVQIQRHFVGQAFGDEDFAQILGKGMAGFNEAYQEAARDVGEISDAVVKAAADFDKSISKFDRSWTSLKIDLGTTVLPGLTAATDGMRTLFDEVKKDPELIGIGAASLGALYARRKIMGAMSGGGGGISPATAAQIEGAAGVQKSASTTFAEAVAEFRAGVREMAARGNGPGGSPVKEAEKEGENFASKLKGALPALATGGVLAAVGAGIATVVLNRDKSKSLVDGGRPDVEPQDNNLGLPGVGEDAPQPSRAPTASAYHPDDDRASRSRALPPATPTAFQPIIIHPDDDRSSRSRAGDAQDRSLDTFVVGALERPVLRLVGTLKTAAAAAGPDAFRPAAFHPAALGAAMAGDPASVIEAGVKAGVLAAFREWSQLSDLDKSKLGGGAGFMPASYGGGGGGLGRRGGGAGGYYDTSGGGSTRAGGTLAANQREAYAAAIGEGLSKTAARALVADLSGEGLAHDAHRVHWDGKHNSGGIAQWDPERAAAIQRQFGHLPWDMDVAGQTRAAIWEYRNNPRFRRTKAAMEGNDAGEMIRQLVVNYENPRDKATAISQRMGYLRGFNPDAPAGDTVHDAIGKLHLAGRVTGVQCVALANAAVGFAGSVRDWRKGIGAAEGTLKDGTPIATFLNRDGSQSSRYAGGGIGTEGAHLDHAAVFRRYIRDAAGKIVGMTVAEQYRNSGGIRSRDYRFHQGWGEGDGANYHAIMGPDGKPLGGRNNPMVAPLPQIAPEPPRRPEQTSRRDDDPAHVHVHMHQDGRLRAMRGESSAGVELTLHSGRTWNQFA